jgi:Protein of unknown function (DUF2971).
MKLYHYTSIETLALILKHKTIRFNRLDLVDDLEESIHGSGPTNIKLGQYHFVSCWTKDRTENISLWKMYTNYKGIRIALDDDMFITYNVNENFKSFFSKTIDFKDNCSISPFINEAKLYDVIYCPNPEDKIKELAIKVGESGCAINTNNVGIYKREEWAFQNESRFKISAIGLYSGSNYPIKKRYFDIPLNPEKLKNIEIMLGPQTTEAEKIIVEALVKEYPNVTILYSYFNGKIRSK